MFEPIASPRLSVVALAASGLILALAACERREPAAAPSPEPAASATPTVVMAPARQIDRAELLAAVDVAASAWARGQSPGGDDTLVGRRLVIRQAFGCSPSDAAAVGAGTTGGEGLAQAAFGRDRKTLQLSLTPADWTEAPLTAGGGESWESVEGFWLPRPWIRTDECPARPSPSSNPEQPVEGEAPGAQPVLAPPASAQTVGLAAVFETGGSRLSRRNGRAYAFTVRGDGDLSVVPPPGGYRLVLEGRAIAFPNGRAIRCLSASPDQRPVCIVAAQVDRVAFEDATGKTLSEWRPN